MKAPPNLQSMVKYSTCRHMLVLKPLLIRVLFFFFFFSMWWQCFCLCVPGLVGPAPTSVRWTCLMLDLHYTLSVYLNRHYSHLKNIKLCANMAVKNIFTSDLLLDPGQCCFLFSEFGPLRELISEGTLTMPSVSFPSTSFEEK